MISVSGTAVFVNYSSNKNENNNLIPNNSISNDVLTNELIKKQIIIKAQNDSLLTQEEWYFLQQNPILNISEKLLTNFLRVYGNTIPKESDNGKILINNITNYFGILENEESINILYEKLIENPIEIFDLIKINNLFSPSKVLSLLEKGEVRAAISCLEINKENYSTNDLSQMSEIIKHLDSLENRGNIKSSKSLLGKDVEKYICPNGHSNNVESEFCESHGCYMNIKGLQREQVEKIKDFKDKVDTLSSLFNKH